MERKRVLVGMSGGVDSAAAAALLQDGGYEAVGCTLRLLVWARRWKAGAAPWRTWRMRGAWRGGWGWTSLSSISRTPSAAT